MSPDEVLCLFVAGAVAAVGAYHAVRLALLRAWQQDMSPLAYVFAGIAMGMLSLGVLLSRWASFDVVSSPMYIGFYLVLGAASLTISLRYLSMLGLGVRDDAGERGNRAAGLALAGAAIGFLCAYAGANIGNGPGWWVVVFCAILSTGSLLLAWSVVNVFAPVAERITVERETSAGIHTALWFVAAGLILGRSVAGDWVSVVSTVDDFIRVAGWIVPPTLMFIAFERWASPASSLSPLRAAVLPAVYLVYALLIVMGVGPW